MLPRRELAVGKGYVNETMNLLCEIDSVINRWTVQYSVYNLTTGKLQRAPKQVGKKHQLIRWADREATGEEMEGLQKAEKEALFKSAEREQMDYVRPGRLEEGASMIRTGSFKM